MRCALRPQARYAGLIASATLGVSLLATTTDAAAFEKNEPLQIRAERPDLSVNWAPVWGLQHRFARDLTWARLSLEDDMGPAPAGTQMELLRPPSLLQGVDIRSGLWTRAPGALPGVATAATSLMTSGLPMFKLLQDGKVRQRHAIRCFFRSSGIKLAWRIEF